MIAIQITIRLGRGHEAGDEPAHNGLSTHNIVNYSCLLSCLCFTVLLFVYLCLVVVVLLCLSTRNLNPRKETSEATPYSRTRLDEQLRNIVTRITRRSASL